MYHQLKCLIPFRASRVNRSPARLSPASSSEFSASEGTDSSLSAGQRGFRQQYQKVLRTSRRSCLNTWHAILKPGHVRDLSFLTLGVAVATSLIITILYLLVFVVKPASTNPYLSRDHSSRDQILTDGKPVNGTSRWLNEFTQSVIPRNCHSHNDYWRSYPLFSALAAGCTGVEADIWLSDDGTELLVGHDRDSLSSQRTLKSMYLDPLLEILEFQNPSESWRTRTPFDQARGVFSTQPNTTLVLLIDVKSDASVTWPLLVKQLEQLREKQFLARKELIVLSPGFTTKQSLWPGPVTVVGTGNLDRATCLDRRHRSYPDYEAYHDTFIDAPLQDLPRDNRFSFYPENQFVVGPYNGPVTQSSQLWSSDDAYYSSASFKQTIGSVHTGFSQAQLALVREHVKVAKQSGLKTRYWDIPDWPIGYRDYIWKVLTEEHVDMLNVDDLESAARQDWTRGYLRDLLWMVLVSVYLFCCGIAIVILFRRSLRKLRDQELVDFRDQPTGIRL